MDSMFNVVLDAHFADEAIPLARLRLLRLEFHHHGSETCDLSDSHLPGSATTVFFDSSLQLQASRASFPRVIFPSYS